MAAARAFLSVLLPLCARQGVSAGEYEYYLGGKQNPQSNGQQAPALNNGQNIYGISFDCMADFDICATRWSERKKAWCQEHRHLLCSFERQAPPQSVRMAPPTTPPTLPPTLPPTSTITITGTSTTRTATSTKTTTTRTTTTRTTTTRTTTTGSSTTMTRAPTSTGTSTSSTRTTTTITGTSTKTTVTVTQTSTTRTQTSMTVTTTTTTLKPTTTTLKVVAAAGSSSVVAGGAGPVARAQVGSIASPGQDGGDGTPGGAQGSGAAGHVGGVSVARAGGGTDVLGSGLSPVAAAAAASHGSATAASQRSPMPTVPPRPPTYPPRGPAPTPGPTPEPFQVTFTLSPQREHPSPSVTFSPHSKAPTPAPYPPPSWPPEPVPATVPPPAPHTMPPPETTTFTLPPTQPPYVPPAAPNAVVTTVATTTTQLVTFKMTAVPTTSTEQVISDASTDAASTSKPTTTSTTNTVTGEAVQVSLEVSGKNATALVQQEDFIAAFRDAIRTGIAAVAGSFFDRVMPADVAVEEHVASEHSLYVFGTVRPQSHGSSKSIRHRLGKNNQRLAQVVVAQMRKLKGLEGLSVTNVEVVGREEEAPTWSNIILGAVHSMGFKMDRMPKSVFHPHHSSAGRAFKSEDAQVESGSTRKAGHELAESETSFHEGKQKNASSHKTNSVAFSMTIHNIDYVKLTKHEGLCYKFKKVVMHTVASAGGSIKRDHVHVDLKPGSVRVRCTIMDLPSSTLKAAEENLRSTKDALAGLIAMRVKALANVDEVMTGEIAVKDLLVFRKLTAVYSGAEDMVPEEEEEAEEEAFEEEEAEGHHWSQYDVGMAELLLGLVAGIILLFYLVNWKDTDIRRNSWTIVSNTIAIFISVLIFDCLSDVVDRLLVGTFLVVHLIVSYLIVLGLFVVMQAVTAILSGTMFDALANDMEEESWVISDVSNPRYGKRIQPEQLLYKLDTLRSMNATKAVALVDGAEVFVSRETLDKEERIINMSSYVTLLTYMTAFAAINAGSTLMNFQFFAASPYAAALPVLLAQVLLGCLFLLFRYARGAHNAGGPEQIWEAECIRAESDIACLSGSFLFVQVTRFLISGKLPDKFGLEHPEEPHSLNCVLLLYLVGFLAAIFSLTVPSFRLPERFRMGDMSRTIQNGTSMVFAWSMIWATRWMALRVPWFRTMGVGPGTLPWQIILTGAAFAIAFIFIVVLRQVERVASDAGEVTRGVISALSLLVGFTFQRLFEEALQKAVRFAPRPFLVEMGASLLIAAFVVPAWRKYILVKVWSFRVGQDSQRYIEAAREPKDPAPLHQQTSFTRLTSWGRKTSESGT